MTPPSPPPPATRTRPLVCTADEVRELLTAGAAEIRRPVKAPIIQARDGRKSVGPMLIDLSRAWVDPGFPLDDDGEVLPMERWGKGADPAPESAYRNQYLHVPVAHPSDGWSADPRDDRWMRLYCPIGGPGEEVRVREMVAINDTAKPSEPPHHFMAEIRYSADKAIVEKPVHIEHWRVTYENNAGRLTPAIAMPRWASRLTVVVESVRIERAGERREWVSVVRLVEGRS